MIKGNWNKKYTKKKSSSQIIDEKIAFLDREMKKTTLGEAIANSTSGLYTVTGYAREMLLFQKFLRFQQFRQPTIM